MLMDIQNAWSSMEKHEISVYDSDLRFGNTGSQVVRVQVKLQRGGFVGIDSDKREADAHLQRVNITQKKSKELVRDK